ncbi:alpha/beta hydrolase [Novilysobacter arseniciresistens]|uniref:alpha/beta hydrolase n=1 Tax=Novilysobacter arseniciresistens TaxID=1385522 RepID=UPI00055FE929|nr:alpha/beta hydrolase [Lysobacter arseniciresistens]
MRKPLLPALVAAALLAIPYVAAAQQCPGDEHFRKARGVVEDLQRIVTPDGIQDTYKTEIGGIDQWVNVRGEHRDNPMILFVHGGPASPTMPSTWQFQRPIEEYFTVAHYDQRGAGKTYLETDPESIADTIRIDTYVDDAIELAEHLRERYGKDKLVLVGHSWGTVVGMKAALERPDLFHAYVGIGQVINTATNERLSVEYGLQQARRDGNATAIAEIESISPYPGDQPITRERIIIARKWPQHYGGLNAYRDAGQDYYYSASLLSPAYDCEDREAFFEGNVFTLGRLLDAFLQVDMSGVDEFPIPVVMFLGRHDYTTPSAPTAEWLEQVDAPYKRAVWFENSAHMMPWEEPGKTLVSLLRYVRPLAVPADADTAPPATAR